MRAPPSTKAWSQMLQSAPTDGARQHVGEGPDPGARARRRRSRTARAGARTPRVEGHAGPPRPASSSAATRSCWASVIPGKIGSDRISPAARSATGKSPGPVPQVGEGAGQVHRDRVVDAGADPGGVEARPAPRPAGRPGRRRGATRARCPAAWPGRPTPCDARRAARRSGRRPHGAPRSSRPGGRAWPAAPRPGACRAGSSCPPRRGRTCVVPPWLRERPDVRGERPRRR